MIHHLSLPGWYGRRAKQSGEYRRQIIMISPALWNETGKQQEKKIMDLFALTAGYLYLYTCNLSRFYLSITIIPSGWYRLMAYLVDNESSTAYLRYKLDRVSRSVTNVPGVSVLREHCIFPLHGALRGDVPCVYSLLGSPYSCSKESKRKLQNTYRILSTILRSDWP